MLNVAAFIMKGVRELVCVCVKASMMVADGLAACFSAMHSRISCSSHSMSTPCCTDYDVRISCIIALASGLHLED